MFFFPLSQGTSFQLGCLHRSWGSLAEHLLCFIDAARGCPVVAAVGRGCPARQQQQPPGIQPGGGGLYSPFLRPSKLAKNPRSFKSISNVSCFAFLWLPGLCEASLQGSVSPYRGVGSDAAHPVPSGGLNTERFFYQGQGRTLKSHSERAMCVARFSV